MLEKKIIIKKEEPRKLSGVKDYLTYGFFGWLNIKWFIKEVGKIFSDEPSYFSKKRIESSAAFIIAQWGLILFLHKNHLFMSMSDLTLWAAIELMIAGYYVREIQKEKKDTNYQIEEEK